jgi:saccharopine dehydrogenase (NAD+, L-lysine-forming)
MTQHTIFIRKETYENELRAPLIPDHVKLLIAHGYNVIVESSQTRVYLDSAYEEAGAIVTKEPWYVPMFQQALIIGIKELTHLTYLNNHKHLYFSHAFKNQIDSSKILAAFRNSNSIIYDIEYFMDSHNRRLIAFGFYAGLVGAALGLLQYYTKASTGKNIHTLKPWTNMEHMVDNVNTVRHTDLDNPKIAIIGANGRSGKGVQTMLDQLKLPYTIYTKTADQQSYPFIFQSYDIIYNAIQLSEDYTSVWVDKYTTFTSHKTIVDISCDYSRHNNPIKLYTKATNWHEPVVEANEYVSIIAIENLPSLIPKESSDHFSEKLYDLLINLKTDNTTWEKNLEIFKSKCHPLPALIIL